MSAAPGTCGERHSVTGARCTRDGDHKGGHRDEVRDIYWQADEPRPQPGHVHAFDEDGDCLTCGADLLTVAGLGADS